jgi:hypothetical protein
MTRHRFFTSVLLGCALVKAKPKNWSAIERCASMKYAPLPNRDMNHETIVTFRVSLRQCPLTGGQVSRRMVVPAQRHFLKGAKPADLPVVSLYGSGLTQTCPPATCVNAEPRRGTRHAAPR